MAYRSFFRKGPANEFIGKDQRITVYSIDCRDTDIISKRNAVFEKIKDGFFYLLDDDTILINNVYTLYKEFYSKGFRGMIIGDQIKWDFEKTKFMKAPFPSEDPSKTKLDTGMVIASSDVLEYVQWSDVEPNANYGRDFLFWSKCFSYFGPENVVMCNKVINFFNFYAPLVRIRKRVLGLAFAIDIYNPHLAKFYTSIQTIKNWLLFKITGERRIS